MIPVAEHKVNIPRQAAGSKAKRKMMGARLFIVLSPSGLRCKY